MRHTFPLLAAVLALVLAVTPAGAHHGKGSHADGATSEEHGSKPAKSDKHDSKSAKSDRHGSEPEEHGGFAACDWESNADDCPGNSGWAHWCKDQHEPGPARGHCVADHASDEHDGE